MRNLRNTRRQQLLALVLAGLHGTLYFAPACGAEMLESVLFARASAATITGVETVSAGDTVNDTTIDTGGMQNVYGTAIDTKINAGGWQDVKSGGAATDTTINPNGLQFVYGAATNTTVNADGEQYVYSRGTATNTTVEDRGFLSIEDGGEAVNAVLKKGYILQASTDAILTTDSPNGPRIENGKASGLTINGNIDTGVYGDLEVKSGGEATNTTINDNGRQDVRSGGTATNTTVNDSGRQHVNSRGTATNTTINSNGVQGILIGGKATNTTINDNGYQSVSGEATNTTVNGNGTQYVSAGVVTNTTVNGKGTQKLFRGGKATNSTINDHGILEIDNNSVATNTTVNDYGKQQVDDGVATNTTINGNGTQDVNSGGTATDTTINDNGTQRVNSGGTATNTTVNDQGTLQIENGARLLGRTAIDGGSLVLQGDGPYQIETLAANVPIDLGKDGAAGKYRTLSIGTLEGDGAFLLHTDLAAGQSDKLAVQSGAGVYRLSFSQAADVQIGQVLAGDAVVAELPAGAQLDMNGSESGILAVRPLLTGEVSGGQTVWRLKALRGVYSRAAEAAVAAPALGLTGWRALGNHLQKRLGDLRAAPGETGLWARVYRGEREYGSLGLTYTGVQGGYDRSFALDGGRVYLGAAISRLDGNSDYQSGAGDSEAKALAFYASYLGGKGHYVDFVARRGKQSEDYEIQTLSGARAAAKSESWATGLSLEYGWRKQLADGWFFEPQAELEWSRLGPVSYRQSGGIETRQEAAESLVGRLGFSAGRKLGDNSYYARVSLLREFDGDLRATVRDTQGRISALTDSLGDTWVEYAVGADLKTGGNARTYLELERTAGAKVKEKWQLNAGVRVQF